MSDVPFPKLPSEQCLAEVSIHSDYPPTPENEITSMERGQLHIGNTFVMPGILRVLEPLSWKIHEDAHVVSCAAWSQGKMIGGHRFGQSANVSKGYTLNITLDEFKVK